MSNAANRPGYWRDVEMMTVPYALFENDDRLTRPFRTEREVWEAAERADLTTTDSHGERVLDNNFEIKPCDLSPGESFATGGQDIVYPERAVDDDTRGTRGAELGRSAASHDVTSVRPGKPAP